MWWYIIEVVRITAKSILATGTCLNPKFRFKSERPYLRDGSFFVYTPVYYSIAVSFSVTCTYADAAAFDMSSSSL